MNASKLFVPGTAVTWEERARRVAEGAKCEMFASSEW